MARMYMSVNYIQVSLYMNVIEELGHTGHGKCNTKSWTASATGNHTPVSRVTGRDTSHYTITDDISVMQ